MLGRRNRVPCGRPPLHWPQWPPLVQNFRKTQMLKGREEQQKPLGEFDSSLSLISWWWHRVVSSLSRRYKGNQEVLISCVFCGGHVRQSGLRSSVSRRESHPPQDRGGRIPRSVDFITVDSQLPMPIVTVCLIPMGSKVVRASLPPLALNNSNNNSNK